MAYDINMTEEKLNYCSTVKPRCNRLNSGEEMFMKAEIPLYNKEGFLNAC